MERWNNRVAVVTGASSGIGAAVCRDLVARNMIVVGLARRLQRMEELKESLETTQRSRFHVMQCDVSNEEDIVKAFNWIDEHLGGADVLVNNAGILRTSRITDEGNTADLRDILETNVLGVAICTRIVFQSMKRRQLANGHVFIINSISGHRVPVVPGLATNIYSPSKFAVTALAEVLRQEFLSSGLKTKITCISPGMTRTEIVGDLDKFVNSPDTILRAEDISEALVYCLQTPPNVQVQDMIIRPIDQQF